MEKFIEFLTDGPIENINELEQQMINTLKLNTTSIANTVVLVEEQKTMKLSNKNNIYQFLHFCPVPPTSLKMAFQAIFKEVGGTGGTGWFLRTGAPLSFAQTKMSYPPF